MTEPTHLTRDQLAPIVAGLAQRMAAGRQQLTPPFPGCPTCDATPRALNIGNDHPDMFTTDRIVIRFQPCGHTFTANRADLYEACSAAFQQEGL